MKIYIVVLAFLILSVSCSDKSRETGDSDVHQREKPIKSTDDVQVDPPVQKEAKERPLPEYLQNTLPLIPDSISIDLKNVIYGDFNGDGKADFSALVLNSLSGEKGVIIIHNADVPEYILFGAGKEINGISNLDWVDSFRFIPKGEIIAPTFVDASTGDILGPEENRFRLVGDGIHLADSEESGGGIIFWNGRRYRWSHLE